LCAPLSFLTEKLGQERIDRDSALAHNAALARQTCTEARTAEPRRTPVWLVPLLGILLVLTAVGPYRLLDDHVLALHARQAPVLAGLPPARWDLFSFTSGERSANLRLIEQGLLLPWWSDPQLKIAFYRPLSSLTHRIDDALWPNAPTLMYLHSIAWLALTLHLVGRLYRQFEVRAKLAGLAALLYAFHPARGAVVAWISNRNALLATAFGLLALLTHDRWRRHAQARGALLSPVCLLLGLLSAELAASTLAYLLAYALFLDRGTLWRRAQTLLPHAAAVAVWMFFYLQSGAGVRGSGTYLSPFNEPVAFVAALPGRICALLGATVGPVSADLALFGRPEHAWLARLASCLVLAAAAYALLPALRHDRLARFWLLGMLLAVLPIAASPPGDRLLSFVGIGGAALVARIVAALPKPELRPDLERPRVVLARAFGIAGLVLAPLLLFLRAAQMQVLGRAMHQTNAVFDGIDNLEQRTVVIVNPPVDLLASYIQAERAWLGLPRAAHLYWLTSAGSPMVVQRSDVDTLLVERERGFLSTPLERHYRARLDDLGLGASVTLSQMTAKVERSTADGRPLAVSFRFAEPLESSSYLFLVWEGDRYQTLDLGRLTQPLQLPASDLTEILARTAVHGAT
jgi:hypothetical protein